MDKKVEKLFKKYTENESALPPAKIRLELSDFFEKILPGSFLSILNEKRASDYYIYNFPGKGTLPQIRKRIAGSCFNSLSLIPKKDWDNHFRARVMYNPEEAILVETGEENDKAKELNRMSIQVFNFYRSLKKDNFDKLEIEIAYMKELCINFAKLWKKNCIIQLKILFSKAKDYFPILKTDIFNKLKTSTIEKEKDLESLHTDWLYEIMIMIQWAELLLPAPENRRSLWDKEVEVLNNLIDFLDQMNQVFMKEYVAFCEHDIDFERTYQKLLSY